MSEERRRLEDLMISSYIAKEYSEPVQMEKELHARYKNNIRRFLHRASRRANVSP
jgi:hypothetical protein